MFDAIPSESTFPFLYFDLACKQLCFPPGKGINRRKENTIGELFQNLFWIREQLTLLFGSADEI